MHGALKWHPQSQQNEMAPTAFKDIVFLYMIQFDRDGCFDEIRLCKKYIEISYTVELLKTDTPRDRQKCPS